MRRDRPFDPQSGVFRADDDDRVRNLNLFQYLGSDPSRNDIVLPEANSTGVAWVMLIGGVVLIGIASGLYIGANLGPGPRDGLMTGIAQRGPSIRLTRAVIEIAVLTAGWILGGTLGIGTLVFALGIGPLVQYFLPRLNLALSVEVDLYSA